jgi:hypothetical protein
MSAYKQQEMDKENGPPCFRPNNRPQKPARGGREKWTDPHVSGPIFNPKNQLEVEEKNGRTHMFQAQYSTPKTSKRWKKKMDGPTCFRPNIQPQKPARDGREKWIPMVQA